VLEAAEAPFEHGHLHAVTAEVDSYDACHLTLPSRTRCRRTRCRSCR
jgi:hypothetical protein